jgi:type I restriction enzyme S subunit
MITLLEERREGAVEVAIRAMVEDDGEVPLKRFVDDVTVGIVVTPSEWYTTEGVVALRGLNIRPDRIDTADVVYLTEQGHRLHQKSALRQGDVVVVRTGQAGAAAVVPPSLDGVNCIDLLVIRPGHAASNFLTFVLNSHWTQKHIASYSVGSIQSHFNVGALRELPVPRSYRHRQDECARELDRITSQLNETCGRLRRQIDLVQEHRQALITAAVTGELDVPGVAA